MMHLDVLKMDIEMENFNKEYFLQYLEEALI